MPGKARSIEKEIVDPKKFIARRLSFQGRLATVSTAVSFLVMIVAVTISAGFRREIRSGLADLSGDVQLTGEVLNYYSDKAPVSSTPSYLDRILKVEGVSEVRPVIYRAGIVKCGDVIQGVLFKGVPDRGDTVSLGVSIPSRLSEILGLEPGDKMLTYFVGERIKVRKFTVTDIYPSIIESDESLLVRADLADLQRLNGWDSLEVSALEVTLEDGKLTIPAGGIAVLR